jgi:hypothetical protein
VIITADLADPGRAQRRDRHRPGIIRVIFVDVSRRKQPHPGGQLGRHIQHPLTRGEQLLGQQMPQPARAFDRPGALRPGLRPPQQPLRLGGAGPYLQLAPRHFRRVDRHRGMRGLVRVDPDHHRHHGNALLPVLDLG